jgi:hypothetical protein
LDFTRVAFIDLEASGLGSASFPVEIGWAIVREDGSIDSASFMIRPPAKWTMYENAWSPASEQLTGITRETLEKHGLAPIEVMTRFLEAVGDRELFSDAPDFDAHWFGMLAEAAGISLGSRTIRDAKTLMDKMDAEQGLTEKLPPARHRAETDARRLAFAFACKAQKGE